MRQENLLTENKKNDRIMKNYMKEDKNMKIYKYLLKYWYFALLAPLCMILEVSMDLVQPSLMSGIIDKGVVGGDVSFILKTGVRMLGFAVLGGIGGVLSGVFTNFAAQNFGNDLRKKSYECVMHFSFQQTDKFTAGSLVTRLTNDIAMVQDFVSVALRMFVRSFFMFAGGIFMMLSLNLTYGVVMACILPLQAAVIFVTLRVVSPVYAIVQKKLDKVNSVVQENVSGARVVKAYVKEEYEKKRFEDANGGLMTTNLKVARAMAVMGPVMMILMNLASVGIICIGGFSAVDGNGIGTVMAGVNYATMIVHSLMMISMMFQSVTRAMASANRISEIIATVPVIKSGNAAPKEHGGEVEFDNVGFYYPGCHGQPILQNISFGAKKGEFVAVLGVTGAGKTSLVNLIPRFYDVTQGTVKVDGEDVRNFDLDDLRSRIGIVMQKSELYAGTIAENIRRGREDADFDEIRKAAHIAQAKEFIEGFGEGYDTLIGEKGASLSGGQKQRICIARAIIRKPEFLILDDAASALDLGTEKRLYAAMRENLSDTTVIMIAQRIASVKHADRILVLENGTISAQGTHEELMQKSEIYKDIYNSQVH